MSDHQAVYPVHTMCRLLGLSPSGYYAWRQRAPSRRERENAVLTEEIVEIQTRSDGTYGAPRIYAELRALGRNVSLNRVARLMRAAEIEGVSRRRKGKTTRRAPQSQPAADLVGRDFSASVPTNSGWPISPTFPLRRASSTSQWWWTPGAAGWWAGRWRRT